ncbi:MAG: M23 family metallopeptidase [Deltaproteobacteria bacterium]
MPVPLIEILSILTVLIPLLSIILLGISRYDSLIGWIIKTLLAASLVLFAYSAGTWAFLTYYLRYVMMALFLIIFARAYFKVRGLPFFGKKESGIKTGILFFILSVLIILDAAVIKSHFYPGEAVELSFPLKKGVYYVLQGGDSPVTNFFHRANPAQRYALDLVKLNRFGNRAGGLSPKSLTEYSIFGDTIYSPCECIVTKAADGFPDQVPHNVDTKNPAGNHVAMECKGNRVFIAHMINGSLMVKQGDHIKDGQEIGKVGNSGNTIEPHLHIHAERKNGEPVPILFNGSFLSLNDTFCNQFTLYCH